MLRENFPDARLEILGYKHIIALAERRYYAAATRSIEAGALARFFARGAELPAELCDYFASSDLIISYLFDLDGIFENNLKRAGVENFLAGPARLDESEHAARQLARPLVQLDLSLGEEAARLFPSSEDRAAAEEFLREVPRPAVAFHPGSGAPRKNWPVAKWRELLGLLRKDYSLVLIGGEADEVELRELEDFATSTARNFPLPVLAAILERCDFFLGHDSGISHIAAAVGTRCLLMFGPTNPKVWAPRNENAQVATLDASAPEIYELMRIGIRT